VTNHTNTADAYIFYAKHGCAIIVGVSDGLGLVANSFAKIIGTLPVTRAGTEEERNKQVQVLSNYQENIVSGEPYAPIFVCAEGSTSNGIYINSFKRGVFAGLQPVTPIVNKWDYSMINPANEVATEMPILLMMLSWGLYRLNSQQLPTF